MHYNSLTGERQGHYLEDVVELLNVLSPAAVKVLLLAEQFHNGGHRGYGKPVSNILRGKALEIRQAAKLSYSEMADACDELKDFNKLFMVWDYELAEPMFVLPFPTHKEIRASIAQVEEDEIHHQRELSYRRSQRAFALEDRKLHPEKYCSVERIRTRNRPCLSTSLGTNGRCSAHGGTFEKQRQPQFLPVATKAPAVVTRPRKHVFARPLFPVPFPIRFQPLFLYVVEVRIAHRDERGIVWARPPPVLFLSCGHLERVPFSFQRIMAS